MCKPRQRGRDYGGPGGSPEIDPSLQLLPPFAAIAGAALMDGRHSRRPASIEAKPQFRPRLSGFQHLVLRCSMACFAFVRGLFRQYRTPGTG
jgi:hypothetical protein